MTVDKTKLVGALIAIGSGAAYLMDFIGLLLTLLGVGGGGLLYAGKAWVNKILADEEK